MKLEWNGETYDTQHERDVLEKLEPSVNVERLDIIGYGGTKFPNWVGNSSFSNMVSLRLSGCKNCTSLPPLGQLPSLEELCIEGFDEVVAVGLEFYGSDPLTEKPFKSLKKLSFEQMPEWKEWNTGVAGAFPLLEDLQMLSCPKLERSFPAPPKLIQFNLNFLLFTTRHPDSCWNLTVGKGSLLKSIKRASCLFSSVTQVIFKCRSLKSCQLDFLPHLSMFRIYGCKNLESLCISEGPLLSLQYLAVRDCPNLKSLPENMHSLLPSLQQLKLRRLPQLDSVPNGRLPSKLKSLLIHDSIKLNALSPSLQSLLSLSSFSFCGDDDVESFPGETLLLPSALTFLRINRLRKLKYLDYKGLQHLTSLRDVMICECPELELIPEESLPSSTEDLILGLKDLDYKGLKHLTSLRQLKIWSRARLEPIPEELLPSPLNTLKSGI
ncbi:unnamed protein product [Dovyalis caffra]|uniref:R13L1/DRL21-like LRR repeat region domain-containing protein n=1 Tax=Dovyalis caffra TaxID=77055 RepID=A0AAV1QME9_9ROSI|nr:unnamed protein product [Dovyalis caffra]